MPRAGLSCELERFIARNLHALERMIRFDLLLHLRLDFLEIVGEIRCGRSTS